MSNSKSLLSVLVIVLVVVIVGGGAYWYFTQSANTPSAVTVATTSPTTTPAPAATTVSTNHSTAQTASASFHPIASGTLLASQPTTSRSSDFFSRIKFAYYYDGSSIFYVEHEMAHSLPMADPATFIDLPSATDAEGYALDKNYVYYLGVVIPNADPMTFQDLIEGDYALDAHAAYWDGSVIPGADIATFTEAPGYYSKASDKNHVYCWGNPYPLGTATGTDCADVALPSQPLQPLSTL